MPLAQIYGINTTTVYGGVRYARQIRDLQAGADIVVACPGRLEDLIEQGALTLDKVEVAVIDEADEMADMGFPPASQTTARPDFVRCADYAVLRHARSWRGRSGGNLPVRSEGA